jgi:hypothetical protein
MAIIIQEHFEQEYLLELVRGPDERLERAFLLPNVSSYEHAPEPAVDVTWSIRTGRKARPVKQSSGYVEERITIQGLSGIEERERFLLDLRQGSYETSTTADGVAYFEAFLAFLREYEEEAALYRGAVSRNRAKAPQLIFRALKEGLSWYVDQVKPIAARRVGSSRMSYEYSLSLITEGVAEARNFNDLVANPREALPRAEAAAMTALKAANAQAASATTVANGAVVAATAAPMESFKRVMGRIPGYLAQFRAPLDAYARQVAQAVELVDEAVRAGLGFPRDVAANLRGFADRALSAVYRIWDGMGLVARDPARLVRSEIEAVVRSVQRTLDRVLGTAGAKLGPPGPMQTSTGGPMLQVVRGTLLEWVRLLPGDDLASLAERHLGDRDRWPEILDANEGMTSAIEMPDGRPVEAGVMLLVPRDGDAPSLRPDALADVLGVDWKWDFRRQDIIAEGDAPTDFVSISGRPNLRQGCLRRATTIQGRVRVFPGMGVPTRIGSNASGESASVFASQVVTQFGRDPRIRRVRTIRLSRFANVLSMKIEVEPVIGSSFVFDGVKAS